MAYLIDTHVWIWSQSLPKELGPSAARLLADPEVPIYVATISTLELARLAVLGKILVEGDLEHWVGQALDLLGGSTIELTHEIALEAFALPGDFHRDPADRILVASARVRRLTLLTADRRILAYPHVASFDARK